MKLYVYPKYFLFNGSFSMGRLQATAMIYLRADIDVINRQDFLSCVLRYPSPEAS